MESTESKKIAIQEIVFIVRSFISCFLLYPEGSSLSLDKILSNDSTSIQSKDEADEKNEIKDQKPVESSKLDYEIEETKKTPKEQIGKEDNIKIESKEPIAPTETVEINESEKPEIKLSKLEMRIDESSNSSVMEGIIDKVKQLQVKCEKYDRAIKGINSELNRIQHKMQSAIIDDIKNKVDRNEFNIFKRKLKKSSGEQTKSKENEKSSVTGCTCNALNNRDQCLCRTPSQSVLQHDATKSLTPVCYCCCSYIKGTNGKSHHTSCECCRITKK